MGVVSIFQLRSLIIVLATMSAFAMNNPNELNPNRFNRRSLPTKRMKEGACTIIDAMQVQPSELDQITRDSLEAYVAGEIGVKFDEFKDSKGFAAVPIAIRCVNLELAQRLKEKREAAISRVPEVVPLTAYERAAQEDNDPLDAPEEYDSDCEDCEIKDEQKKASSVIYESFLEEPAEQEDTEPDVASQECDTDPETNVEQEASSASMEPSVLNAAPTSRVESNEQVPAVEKVSIVVNKQTKQWLSTKYYIVGGIVVLATVFFAGWYLQRMYCKDKDDSIKTSL